MADGVTYRLGCRIFSPDRISELLRRWERAHHSPFRQLPKPAVGFVNWRFRLLHISAFANQQFATVDHALRGGNVRELYFTEDCRWWAGSHCKEVVYSARSPARSGRARKNGWVKETTDGPFESYEAAVDHLLGLM